MKLKVTFSDFFVGLPAGILIFISTLLFTTLLGRILANVTFAGRDWLALPVLAFDAFVVGLLARLLRPYHGPGTALAAGILATLIFLGLRLSAGADGRYNPVIFGLPGLAVSPAFCLLGAWAMGHWQRKKDR
jgi:hypothetical protein